MSRDKIINIIIQIFSGIELQRGNSANAGNVRNHEFVPGTFCVALKRRHIWVTFVGGGVGGVVVSVGVGVGVPLSLSGV
jgi:hypothetical protein